MAESSSGEGPVESGRGRVARSSWPSRSLVLAESTYGEDPVVSGVAESLARPAESTYGEGPV